MGECKVGRVEEWEVGKMEGWKVGRVEGWKNGRLEGWKNGTITDPLLVRECFACPIITIKAHETFLRYCSLVRYCRVNIQIQDDLYNHMPPSHFMF